MSSMLKKIRAAKAEKSDSVPEMSQLDPNTAPLMGSTTPGDVTPSGPMSGFGFNSTSNSATHTRANSFHSNPPSTSNGLLSAQTPYTPEAGSNGSHMSWIGQREAFSIMASHLHKVSRSKNWFSEDPNVASGVALRLSKGQYVMCPAADPRLESFYQALTVLNVEVALKITSPVVNAITSRLAPGTDQIPLTPSEHVQVVETMLDVAGARKAQNAAFVRQDRSLVIWTDHVDRLEESAQTLEEKMIAFVWKSASKNAATEIDASTADWNYNQAASQLGHGLMSPRGGSVAHGGSIAHDASSVGHGEENEKTDIEADQFEERPTNLQAPLLHGLAVALDLCLLSLMLKTLVQEGLIDNQWLRMAIFAAAPFIGVIMLFFCDNIIGSVAMILLPIRHMSANTRYYSGKAPKRMTGTLPHITIQMPVYKESLEGVLKPTIASLEKAISTYELQGGQASIIVSEDGMQLISEEDRAIRQEYYDMHNIGWVSRPPHGKDGFVRKGRFKKASNLNFTCQLSLAVEHAMAAQRPTSGEAFEQWTASDEKALYQSCLEKALPELHEKAEAAGNIRIGDLILLIDSDTRVPEDCFLDAASEMSQCPDVGVLQHCSGVMLVTDSYFEKGIAFFTKLVNYAISYVVSNGDVAPFMGHNAFLRWSAAQEASFVDPEDGVTKVWSESHVSEDFDMALRLLMKGYITRWATYSNNQFEEGVSLTCDDELNRWQKYAFGCSELVFHPLRQWIFKGPLTPLFKTFLWSNACPIHYKFSACSYIFSYYAIGTALPLTVGLYFAQGWFFPVLDPVFLPPFQTFVAVMVVFSALGNVANVIGRFRSKQLGLFKAALEHLTWLPFMLTFFGGMSYHVMTALIAHPLGINMTWGATVKDLEDSNFFLEIPAIFKRFWRMFLLVIVLLAGVVVLDLGVLPLDWVIEGFFTMFPLILMLSLHLIYPIVLNPSLLRFSF